MNQPNIHSDRNAELLHQALATPAQVPVNFVQNPYSAENPFIPITDEQAVGIKTSMQADNVSRNLIATVIDLENQRDVDTLTGAGSLYAARQDIQELIDTGHHLDLYFLDFNNFKQVNDQMGHDAGDSTLITLTSALVGKLRSGEKIYRVGGDEFIIVKNRDAQANRRHEGANMEASQNQRKSPDRREHKEDDTEGLRSRIATALEQSLGLLENIMGKELSLKMGISVGHARHEPGQSLDELWKAADIDMYRDKLQYKPDEVKGLTEEAYYLSRLNRIRGYLKSVRATRDNSPSEGA